MSDWDVVILGAGAAGLSAAAALSESSLRVLVLEARDSVGGRIRSSGGIELGAEFVHGKGQSTLAHAGPSPLTLEDFDRPFIGLSHGREISAAQYESLLKQVSSGLSDGSHEASVQAYLDSLTDELELQTLLYARQYYEGFHAAHLDRFGTGSLVQSSDQQENLFRLKETYSALIENLLSKNKAEIKLGWKVREVSWSQSKVKIKALASLLTPPAQFSSKAALVTLPLSVLKGFSPASVKFAPELTEKKSALARLEMGSAVKLSLQFEPGFGEAHGFGKKWLLLMTDSEEPFHVFWWGPPGSESIVAWAGGPKALALSRLTAEQKRDAALDSLARTLSLPHSVTHLSFKSMQWHDWQADPYSAGAYSYGGVGGKGAFEDLAKPIGETLFFAGEATHPGKNGTVEGAIESGERAAKEILAAFK